MSEIITARVVQAGRLISHEGLDAFAKIEELEKKVEKMERSHMESLEQLESMFKTELGKLACAAKNCEKPEQEPPTTPEGDQPEVKTAVKKGRRGKAA